jgi:hypothetical protein
VAVGDTSQSNGGGNALVLANNEPAGSTPINPGLPPPPTGTGITDVVVVGTFADALPTNGKGPHKTA